MKNISILGAGGHTRSSINLINQHFENVVLNIYDDNFDSKKVEYINSIELVGKISDIGDNIFLSIGDNKKREEYFNLFYNNILKQNLIHKKAFIENNIKIGLSNQIFANVYINSLVEIGDNNILNTSSILEHEVKIGNHNHISIGAKLCGRVTIGNNCFIGSGAIIIDKVFICDNVIVGAGTVVIGNITEPGTYVGNPARKIK